jgi:uncharacterized protein YcgI (DUF1989 family)
MTNDERYHHRRPFDAPFYDAIAIGLASVRTSLRSRSLPPEGLIERLSAGDVVTVRLVRAPQIVHVFAWNPDDPDERIWPHETSGMENAFLRRHSRIWGMMARFRPLLTVVEDTVVAAETPVGSHHFVLGGFEVPQAWRMAGGSQAVPSSWERFEILLRESGLNTKIHRDHVSLFQKMVVDPATQRFFNAPSDARGGDRVSLYAEVDLAVALVPSPYRGGGIEPDCLDGSVEPVVIEVRASGVRPIGWPYPGVPYPDITPYVDAQGRRT